MISIVPFVVAVLRYAVDVDSGNGGEPEEIALGDRVLQVLALLWVGIADAGRVRRSRGDLSTATLVTSCTRDTTWSSSAPASSG